MLSNESLYVIFFSLPLYQLIFFTVQAISFRWSAGRSRFMLGMMLLVISLSLLSNMLYYFNYFETFRVFYYFHIPLLLSILPVSYIYIQTLAEGLKSINPRRMIVLMLPALLVFVLNIFTWGRLEEEVQMQFLRNGFNLEETGHSTGTFVIQVFWLGNVALLGGQLALVLLRAGGIILKARRAAENDPAVRPYLNMKWLVTISLGTILMVITLSLMNIFTPGDNLGALLSYNLSVLIFGGMTGYFGLRQDQLIKEVSGMQQANSPGQDVKKDAPGPSGSITETDQEDLSPDTEEKIRLLQDLLEKEKPYLKADLTITGLADMMGISKRELSFIINSAMKQNFYGIINEYRMEETLRILQGKEFDYLTIEAIAEKVGFRSKSSFNACFKKYTGMTPSQYKEKLKD
jgi:AraC-like DNA-binding protein